MHFVLLFVIHCHFCFLQIAASTACLNQSHVSSASAAANYEPAEAPVCNRGLFPVCYSQYPAVALFLIPAGTCRTPIWIQCQTTWQTFITCWSLTSVAMAYRCSIPTTLSSDASLMANNYSIYAYRFCEYFTEKPETFAQLIDFYPRKYVFQLFYSVN